MRTLLMNGWSVGGVYRRGAERRYSPDRKGTAMLRTLSVCTLGFAICLGLLGPHRVASAQNVFPTTGQVGIGTTSPGSALEVLMPSHNYWTSVSHSWSGILNPPPQSFTITNSLPGGWDPVMVWRMATSTGTLKPAFALGAVGTASWTDSNTASQVADVYLISRDSAGVLQERLRVTSTGNIGIGTTVPVAQLHVAGSVQVDGNIAAKYQDVAEWVKSDAVLPTATVVSIDPREQDRVRISAEAYDTRVAGVVSSRPGLLLGEAGEDKAKVAHSGRVRVKVDARYGPIATGDLLVTSPTPGHAMRSEPVNVGGAAMHRPGTLIGKALEPLNEGVGEVLILLTLQ